MSKTELNDTLLSVWVVAGCLIEQDDKYLLVQEKLPEVYGLWNFPAGRVEKNQTLKEAAIREAKEETGFDVEVVKELGVYHKDGEKAVKHVFEAKILGGELQIQEDEILDVRWLTYDEIIQLDKESKIRSDWVTKAIELYQEN